MEYQIALLIGVGIMVVLFLAYIISWGTQHLWAWVDDDKISEENYLVAKLQQLSKFKVWNRYNGYGLSENVPDWYIDIKWGKNIVKPLYLKLCGVGFIAPITLLICYKLYAVTLFVMTIALVLFSARFTRRLSKKFNKHTEDSDAHDR